MRKAGCKSLRSSSSFHHLLAVLGFASLSLTLVSVFGPTLYVVDRHHALSQQQHLLGIAPKKAATRDGNGMKENNGTVVVVEVADLEHEDWFRATIKSCVPSSPESKCKKVHILEDGSGEEGNPPVQRVAVISPPGELATALANQVDDAVSSQHKRRRREEKLPKEQQQRQHLDPDIDLIVRSSVPPYGYGKSHGLSKIIRLVPRPVLLQVADALSGSLLPDESVRDVTLEDVKAALRQILRFHCRLSAVAAHTPVLSIDLTDLLADRSGGQQQQQQNQNQKQSVIERIESFLMPNEVAERDGKNQGDDLAMEYVPDDDSDLFETQEAFGTQLLTHVQSTLSSATSKRLLEKRNLLRVLDDVLVDEIRASKNMTIWPCPSFWTVGEEPEPLRLSPIVQRIAKALSPECGPPAPQDSNSNNNLKVSCFVARDVCESKGDGVCNNNKKKR